jgi:cytosine deaminase
MATASSLLLHDVRLWTEPDTPVDVICESGRITAVAPCDPAGRRFAHQPPFAQESDHDGQTRIENGRGLLALPAFVDAHAHVDKTLWGTPWVPHSAGPLLTDRIANERARRTEFGLPSTDNAESLIRQMISAGTTALRTHTDVDPGIGLAGIEVVAAAAERLAGLIVIQQVAFPQAGVIRSPGTLDLLAAAVQAGAAVIGGIDPAGVDNDPIAQLDALFALAAEHGAALDFHLHDEGTLGLWETYRIIERTVAFGLQGRVAISHADAASAVAGPDRDRLADALAEAGVALVTAAVYDVAVPSLPHFAERGVTVACGNDGIRDLWGPYGTGDMLERAMHVAYRNGLRRDDEIELAIEAATTGGARVLGLPDRRLEVGGPADLVLVDALTAAHAVAARPSRELVVHAGSVVARSGAVQTELESVHP